MQRLEALKILWGFPAKAFSVSLSVDGEHWVEAFATAANVLNSTSVNLRGKRAAKVNIVMQQTHPVYGTFQGRALYGIRSVSVLAPRLRTVVDDCAAPAKSKDARDKYFASFVSEFDPSSSQALRAELSPFESAKASSSATVSEVEDIIPKLPLCRPTAAFLPRRSLLGNLSKLKPVSLARSSHVHTNDAEGRSSAVEVHATGMGTEQATRLVDVQHGIDASTVQQLMHAAKAAIVEVRGVLK